jgi:hypothetical protein
VGIFPCSPPVGETPGADGITQTGDLHAALAPLESDIAWDALSVNLAPRCGTILQFTGMGDVGLARPTGVGRQSDSDLANHFFLAERCVGVSECLWISAAESPSEALCFKPDSFRCGSVCPTVRKLSRAFLNDPNWRLRAAFSHSRAFVGLGTNGNKTRGIWGYFRTRGVGNTGVKMGWTYLGRKRSPVQIRAPRPSAEKRV